MERILLYILVTVLSVSTQSSAQSYAFGLKGGGVLASQNWSGANREPIISYQGDLYTETYDPKDRSFAFGASLGYHIRGSALRYASLIGSSFNGNNSLGLRFGNLMLDIYAKQIFNIGTRWQTYYHFGIRGELNIVRDFDFFTEADFDPYIQKFTYGISAGGGLQFNVGELTGGFLEFSILPDLSRQIFIPQSTGFTNPTTGSPITFKSQSVTNFSVELTLGLYLVHLIEYID